MGRVKRTLGPVVTIAGALALWLVVMVTVGASVSPRQNAPAPSAKAAAAPAAQAAAAPASGYVGEETCLTCHEDRAKGYHGSKHSRKNESADACGHQRM